MAQTESCETGMISFVLHEVRHLYGLRQFELINIIAWYLTVFAPNLNVDDSLTIFAPSFSIDGSLLICCQPSLVHVTKQKRH